MNNSVLIWTWKDKFCQIIKAFSGKLKQQFFDVLRVTFVHVMSSILSWALHKQSMFSVEKVFLEIL